MALTGELLLAETREFTLALAFGEGLHNAGTTLLQALARPFTSHLERFTEQWRRPCRHMLPLEATCGDGGHLYRGSYTLLLSHEDKAFPGALIASVAIPWGEVMGDEDTGGYHLVWTRDLVNSATGLLAAGNKDTPSTPTALGIAFADIVTTPDQKGSIRFTFFWPEAGGWEGTNYQVTVDSAG